MSEDIEQIIAAASSGRCTIANDGASITCHRCGLTSYNANDVAHRYCGSCHVFHDSACDAVLRAIEHITAAPAFDVSNLLGGPQGGLEGKR